MKLFQSISLCFDLFLRKTEGLLIISPHPFKVHLLEPESHRKEITTPKMFYPRPHIEENLTQTFPGSIAIINCHCKLGSCANVYIDN